MPRTITMLVPETKTPESKNIPLDVIPDDVKQEIEDMYTAQKTNPAAKFRIAFENKQELLQYVQMATAYCAQRPAGEIRIRKSPTRDLADNVGDFKVKDLPADGTAQVRDATAKVNGASAITTEVATPVKATTRSRKATVK